jgi:hypothetical protein
LFEKVFDLFDKQENINAHKYYIENDYWTTKV